MTNDCFYSGPDRPMRTPPLMDYGQFHDPRPSPEAETAEAVEDLRALLCKCIQAEPLPRLIVSLNSNTGIIPRVTVAFGVDDRTMRLLKEAS